MIPIHHSRDFDFNSARSSPRRHISGPSTPKRFGEYYFSAPSSPSRISQFYRDFEEFYYMVNEGRGGHEINNGGYDDQKGGGGLVATVPFDWEEKPGKPKVKSPAVVGGSNNNNNNEGEGGGGYDFAFEVREDFDTVSVSAEDLFDGGVIKPLKPPPRLQLPDAVKAKTGPAISPRHHKESAGAFGGTGTSSSAARKSTARTTPEERERGRERAPSAGMCSSTRRATRSLSPLRVSDEYPPWEDEDQQQQQKQTAKEQSTKPSPNNNFACNSSALSTSSKNLKKWSFKDFFLFRSASEGRAADKDPFRKYTAFRRYEEARISISSSGRSIESPGGSTGGSISRRRGPPVSAHELHYTVNRAASEDMKKKTFLPYKQGILGRLAFNPAVHALANGFGFSRNSS